MQSSYRKQYLSVKGRAPVSERTKENAVRTEFHLPRKRGSFIRTIFFDRDQEQL